MKNPKLKSRSVSVSPNVKNSIGGESYLNRGHWKDRSKYKRKVESSCPVGESKQRRKDVKGDDLWEWWKEDGTSTGAKWSFLEHKGPVFAPEYERLPPNVKFYYDGNAMELSAGSEEVAGFYARMQGQGYAKKAVFNDNFLKDWQTFMTELERAVIVCLGKCDFGEMSQHFKALAEARKAKSKEEKQLLAKERERITSEYGFCVMDGHKQRIGNFKIEPPGLFRGRGEHPKMGCVKRRVEPEDVTVNCSRDSVVPTAPSGHHWKEVRHDPSVCWLACWADPVQQTTKYVLLNASSKMRGERDWRKYEVARRLHPRIDAIRRDYVKDMQSKEMGVRQRAVALYFIDKLALRAGNEKGDDEADTVGCCSLRVEHVRLGEQRVGASTVYEIELDFLGKDSIRYQNCMPVLKRVYKNVARFMEDKMPMDLLFDRLNTSILNQYLTDLMEGLTAKVFRTYNASRILEEQLDRFTDSEDSVENKVFSYNRANRAVAILCNHQRSVPKTFKKSMEKLDIKIEGKKIKIEAIKKEARKIKIQYKKCKDTSKRDYYEKLGERLSKLQEKLNDLERSAIDKNDNKEVSLGTSKLNYLDPRITVSWCLRNQVPIEKIYSKTQIQKFRWAIDNGSPNFLFCDMESDLASGELSGSGDCSEPDVDD